MEFRTEENPWKHKGRVKWVSFGDVVSFVFVNEIRRYRNIGNKLIYIVIHNRKVVAVLGIAYASFRMFTFYNDITDPDVTDFVKQPGKNDVDHLYDTLPRHRDFSS
jgi:hypothetical protein